MVAGALITRHGATFDLGYPNLEGIIENNNLVCSASVFLAILMVAGIFYSMAKLLNPGLWGLFGKRADGEASIPTAILIVSLMVATTGIGLACLKVHQLASDTRGGLESTEFSIVTIIDVVKSRGQEFNQLIVSLNDSMTEGRKSFRHVESRGPALRYQHKVSSAMEQLVDFKSKPNRYLPIVDEIKSLTVDLTAFWYRISQERNSPNMFQTYRTSQYWAFNSGPLFQNIANDLLKGGEQLADDISRAELRLPNPLAEASLLEEAFTKDIKSSSKPDSDASPFRFETFDPTNLEKAAESVKSALLKRIRKASRLMRQLGYNVVSVFVVAFTIAVFLVFVNRIKYPLLGLLSVAGFAGCAWTALKIRQQAELAMERTNALCVNDRHFDIAGTSISRKHLSTIRERCLGGDNFLEAAKAVLGEGRAFNGALYLQSHEAAIHYGRSGRVHVPYDLDRFGDRVLVEYKKMVRKSTVSFSRVLRIADSLKKHGHSCLRHSKLRVPDFWVRLQRDVRMAIAQVDEFEEFWKALVIPPDEQLDPTAYMLAIKLRDSVMRIEGTCQTVLHLSSRLQSVCNAQREAAHEVRANSTVRIAPDSKSMMKNIQLKSDALVRPILSCTFLAKPIETSLHEMCIEQPENLELIFIMSQTVVHLSLVCLFVAILLSKVHYVIWRGIKTILFPILALAWSCTPSRRR